MERHIAFLKILIAAAWADERLSPSEIRTLSYYLQRLRVSADEYQALRPLLEQPISREEAHSLIEEQLKLLSGTEEQRTLVAAVEGLLAADDKLTPPEAKFLRELRQMTHNLPTAQVFISRLKSLWTDGPPHRQPQRDDTVDRFVQKRLLEYFRGRIALTRARAGMAPDDVVDDRDLYRVVLWAGLLGRVADADNELRPTEKDQLLDILRGLAGAVPEPDLLVIADASLDGSMSGIELKTLTGELLKLAPADELGALLDSLFLVAAADGKLMESEVKVIREVAQGAGFEEQAFRASLARCQRRMRSGWN
jgi:uncharacterized tellurite resistance protein B-like protein